MPPMHKRPTVGTGSQWSPFGKGSPVAIQTGKGCGGAKANRRWRGGTRSIGIEVEVVEVVTHGGFGDFGVSFVATVAGRFTRHDFL